MTGIPRWSGVAAYRDDNGPWVTYADHVEALRQAEKWVIDQTADAYEQGQRDALAAAVQRVEAAPWLDTLTQQLIRERVIAAIKGEQ